MRSPTPALLQACSRVVRFLSRSTQPQWVSVRLRPLIYMCAPWGCIVRVDELEKSRKTPAVNILLFLVSRGRAVGTASVASSSVTTIAARATSAGGGAVEYNTGGVLLLIALAHLNVLKAHHGVHRTCRRADEIDVAATHGLPNGDG